jgi:CRISPR system Cascade subunit CasB
MMSSPVTTISATINRAAAILEHGGAAITPGDAAALRRMDPNHPTTAYYKLEAIVAEDGGGWVDREGHADTRWTSIMTGLAILGDLHRPGMRLGRVLAGAGFSEVRFARLLRADGDRLVSELPMLARFLRAKLEQTDWADAARLILSYDRADEDAVRRTLARDYYGSLTTTERD